MEDTMELWLFEGLMAAGGTRERLPMSAIVEAEHTTEDARTLALKLALARMPDRDLEAERADLEDERDSLEEALRDAEAEFERATVHLREMWDDHKDVCGELMDLMRDEAMERGIELVDRLTTILEEMAGRFHELDNTLK